MVNHELVNQYLQMNNQASDEIDTVGEVSDATINELTRLEGMLTNDDISYLAVNYLSEHELDGMGIELFMN